MKNRQTEAAGRREFLRACGRGLAVGALGALAYALREQTGRVNPTAAERCGNRGICRGCDRVEKCGLPQALSLKAARGTRMPAV
jgi:hypothetical protein